MTPAPSPVPYDKQERERERERDRTKKYDKRSPQFLFKCCTLLRSCFLMISPICLDIQFVWLSSSPVSLRSSSNSLRQQPFLLASTFKCCSTTISPLVFSYRALCNGDDSISQLEILSILSYSISTSRVTSTHPTLHHQYLFIFLLLFCICNFPFLAPWIWFIFFFLLFSQWFSLQWFTWNHFQASTTDSRSCALRESYGKRYRWFDSQFKIKKNKRGIFDVRKEQGGNS